MTSDPCSAARDGTRALSPHRLRPVGAIPFATRLHAVDVGAVTVGYKEYAGEVVIESTAPLDYYMLLMPLRGRLDIAKDGAAVGVPPGSGAVVGPGDGLNMRFAGDSAELVAKIPLGAMQRHMRGLGRGRGANLRVRFALTTPGPAEWMRALAFASATVDRCARGTVPAETGRLIEDALVSTLLLSQPHDLAAELYRGPDDDRALILRVAEELHALPARPSIPELAHRHGLSTRALQDGFRRVLGVPPSVYLRDLRLDRVHGDLSRDAGDTVAEVAYRAGFTHLGRFGIAYRRRFGVLPSMTLATARRARDADTRV
ncbi:MULTISPECIES: AraC family transcriptional regulator [unclassified Amycolatopsis]|uniref:AraC family transcriptional regulator n=1 Tax=unclassified Amycolatopsis TaxID=2618356 RepID=UPI001C695240|nr:AraC family transcriptional regulator [Amycolatopsis sp. DSM 110486]QYN20222.1 AraC family transcriptional regulator [Amycolatopsis sp. DSM 110486]